jgi:hypothetical protein
MLELESEELGVDRVVESGCCVYITRRGVRNAGYMSRGQQLLRPYHCCAYHCSQTRGAQRRNVGRTMGRWRYLILLFGAFETAAPRAIGEGGLGWTIAWYAGSEAD